MKIERDNISYYDAIAKDYNDMLQNNSDKIVRRKVADKFCSIAKNNAVLDFGGGTGLDLEWLNSNFQKVLFCEPSKGMREVAIHNSKNLRHLNITFLDDVAADFRLWHSQLPFNEKVDAVLANFAVLNCIPDIDLLFTRIALVINPGGNMLALVLTKNIKKVLRQHFSSALKSVMKQMPMSININYKTFQQTVYIYSLNEIKKASKKDFIFCSSEILPGSGFTLIHLKRK